MYFFLFFLLLIVLCLGLFFRRRHRAMKKLRCMTCCEKQRLLDTILEPFGYYYESKQDLVSTRNDACVRPDIQRFLTKQRYPFIWYLMRFRYTLTIRAAPG